MRFEGDPIVWRSRDEYAVRFLLDGLGVGSLSELNRLVALGRHADVYCAVCDNERYRQGDVTGCVNAYCPRFDHDVWQAMVANRVR